MPRIGHIFGIVDVKAKLDNLKQEGLIRDWELPYENLLTRVDAAVFLINADNVTTVRERLAEFTNCHISNNENSFLSPMRYRLEFPNKDSEL